MVFQEKHVSNVIFINILDIAYYGTLSSMFTYQVMSVANHNVADVLIV